jgi:hypothetical protein
MSDMTLKYPVWQKAYRQAVLETNPKLLKQKVAAAEQAVNLRLNELTSSADHADEKKAMANALDALKVLAESDWAE